MPATYKANNIRRNYQFTSQNNIHTQQLFCDLQLDHKNKKVSINHHNLGLIARTYLTMHQKYNIGLTQEEILSFQKLDKQYPKTKWEHMREQKILQIELRN